MIRKRQNPVTVTGPSPIGPGLVIEVLNGNLVLKIDAATLKFAAEQSHGFSFDGEQAWFVSNAINFASAVARELRDTNSEDGSTAFERLLDYTFLKVVENGDDSVIEIKRF